MINQLKECFDKPELFQILIDGLQRDLAEVTKIKDANADFEMLPGQIQYWLSMKASLEFLKRSIERQMKLTSVPRLIELVKKSNYVSSKLLDTALESMPEYSLLNEHLSMTVLVIDTIQSVVTGMWFKKDALVNLTASKRRQMDSERFEY